MKHTLIPKVSGSRPAAALKRLHITPQQLATAPPLTPMLKLAAGGLKQVMSAMRMASSNEVIGDYLAKYDRLPVGDRRHLPMEAIALAAGVDFEKLMGAIQFALQSQAISTVKIIAVTNHPKITAARVKFGLRAAGERDRTALDTALGLLPTPKTGPTIIGQAIFGSGKGVMDAQGAGKGDDAEDAEFNETDPDLDRLFPPANRMQEKLVAIRQKILPVSTS